jgi:hypothetical protein
MFESEISIMPESHISKCQYLLNQEIWETRKRRHLDCFSQRSLFSLAQGKVTQVKIMLMSSSLKQDKERLKEESSWQAQAYSFCVLFIS